MLPENCDDEIKYSKMGANVSNSFLAPEPLLPASWYGSSATALYLAVGQAAQLVLDYIPFTVLILVNLLFIYVHEADFTLPTAYSDSSKVQRKTINSNGTNLPDPDPLPHLTPETLKTFDDRPWRPFRWPYNQTMSLLKLDINHWLDMDKWAWRYYAEAQKEINNRGKDVRQPGHQNKGTATDGNRSLIACQTARRRLQNCWTLWSIT